MNAAKSDKFLECGVDYITATARSGNASQSLKDFGNYLVTSEAGQGAKLKVYRGSGYHGLQAGSAAYGRRPDGCMVRLGGTVAREHWNQLYAMADNITRLDVQVTIVPALGPTKTLQQILRRVRRRIKGRGRPFKTKVFSNLYGPETIRFGRGQSDQMGRIYDKWVESRDKYYLGALRFEAQLMKRFARHYCEQLDRSNTQDATVFSMVDTWFQEHHVAPLLPRCFFEPDLAASCNPEVPRVLKELRTNLTWLSVQVKPTVQRLIHAGKEEQVLAALGLTHVGQLDLMGQNEVLTDWTN